MENFREFSKIFLVGIVCIAAYAIADLFLPQANDCTKIIEAINAAPFGMVMLDECEGKSWLLVRSPLSDQPEGSFTYNWYALERLDFSNPSLVERN